MVGGIILIDVALLTAWEVADPLKWEQHNFTERVRKSNDNSQTDRLPFFIGSFPRSYLLNYIIQTNRMTFN